MHPHEEGLSGGNLPQIGLEPAELVGREALRVVEIADRALCAARVGEERVVELNVMDVADVERVVGRPEGFAPGILRSKSSAT